MQDDLVSFVWGRLEVLEKIGEGGFGEVYRAHDDMLERDVALKLRRPDAPSSANILEEARCFASVRHPNVLSIFGVDRHEGRVGFWSELVDGKTLEAVVEESGPLGPREAALIAVDLCRALAAVHEAGLVHGDVKASNVMRERGGRIVLMDFGTCGRIDEGRARAGTPEVMAPEVLRGGAPTAASDLYGLGALLYFLTCGEYPENIPLLDRRADLPPTFVRVVEHALAENPENRPASAGAMAQELGRYLESPAPPPPKPPSPPRPSRRPALLFGAAALAAAALIGAVALFAPRALHTQAQFFRTAGDRVESLAFGAQIEPGDRLHLELDTDHPVHLYVLNEDDRGDVFVLFPLAGLDRGNPLPAGTHRLPGTLRGESFDWQVTSRGGRERFLVAAAESSLSELEDVIRAMDVASAGRPVEIAATLRGVGGLERSSEPRRELDRLAEALAAGGARITRFELENRAP